MFEKRKGSSSTIALIERSRNRIDLVEKSFLKKYEEMHQSGGFGELPAFPEEGSIGIIDGVVVVKISGAY